LTLSKRGDDEMPDRQRDLHGLKGNAVSRIGPFLRWAGGKRQLRKILLNFLPEDIGQRTYREPFLGGGSLFFALRPKTAILSDANEHLIRCYKFVRDEPSLVARYLHSHAAKDDEAYYYRVREKYHRSEFSAAQAARFIYLNKTCFNGIFRVNAHGKFNVPYGQKESPAIPSDNDLVAIAGILKDTSLKASSYEKALEDASRGNFIYLDPPYPPLNGTAYFTHYTSDRFSEEDQRTLAERVHELDKSGCLLMVSNADTPLIRRLYRRYELVSLPVIRYLTCKSVRHKAKELVITNYEVNRACATNALVCLKQDNALPEE
jgi:DNA adenine methylase